MINLFSKLNISWFFAFLVVILIAVGLIPREASFFLLGFLIFYVIFSSLEDAVSLFVRLIPFFIALPITGSFDNFNSWRIVSIIIFLKWIFEKISFSPTQFLKKLPWGTLLKEFWQNHRIGCLIFFLFVLAGFSLFEAVYLFAGIKRIIYFINLILISLVVADLVRSRNYFPKIIKDVIIAGSLVVIVGFLQLFSAYFLSFADFMNFWAAKVQNNFYGHHWAEIAMAANTWFAYNMSETLRLRVFSTFPDSHSFPLFLLAVFPFILVFGFNRFIRPVRKHFIFGLAGLFLFFLIIILSGTRGIWASILFPFLFLGYEALFNKNLESRKLICSSLTILMIFFVSFGAAYLILQKPQFLIQKADMAEGADVFKRISSIIDTGEISNFGRIQIWQKTLKSMEKNSLLGVGIGNFPVVLKENIESAKAGASAHNLYLNIGAEMGILAMILFLWLFWLILKKAFDIFHIARDTDIKFFGLWSVICLLWIYSYNLTDAALFDERAFLMFSILSAVVLSVKYNG